ncbi:hypothetical protein AVEN_219654-1 [Araneus ventricosus]|uniref:Formin GTPase-binding domain-containing protein n=1 Tax=Araneus ventricosus TaxID=182803 RepID=A0A4Y2T8M0_ARAVE|nr:hypothetical protein AVEN_219654-1 [Araneus ventricosus]
MSRWIKNVTDKILPAPNGEGIDDSRWSAVRSIFRRSRSSRSPGDLASELRTPSTPLYVELRRCLKDPEWARSFVKENGIETLLETLKSLPGRSVEEVQLKVECGQCLRLVMDTRVGLDYIMENADYTQKLVTGKEVPFYYSIFLIQDAFEKYGEWSHKIKETTYANKIPLLAFKVINISCNTLLTSVVQLLETVSKRFFRYRSKHRCHTLLDLRNVGKA